MQRLLVPWPRLLCHRCRLLSSATASSALTSSSIQTPQPQPSSPQLLLQPAWLRHRQPHNFACRRGFVTLDGLRDGVHRWFAEGPEAASAADDVAAASSPPSDALEPASEAASSFFVQDAPAALQELLEGSTADVLAGAVEPSFASLGLGTGLWPSSLSLKLLETVHLTLDTPWWLCCILLGVSVRLLLLLPNMYLQRMMRTDLPKLRVLLDVSERIRFSARSGNTLEGLRLQQMVVEQFPDLTSQARSRSFLRRNLLIVLGNFFAMTFIQLGSIRGIYRATALPVESFQQGGILWLSDLTCIDPYFVLPTAITGLLMLNIRYYFKTVAAANDQMLMVKPLAYTLLPVFVFTCIINFPGANLYYFLSTGITAQLLHLINTTDAAKEFWKSRIGLPRVEEMPLLPSSQASLATERIRNEILPAMNNRDYQTTRIADRPGDAQIPKTFRIRQGHKLPPKKATGGGIV